MSDLEGHLRQMLGRLGAVRDGYRDGADLARTPMMATLMSALCATHMTHLHELRRAMRARGWEPGQAASAMGLVHKAVLNVRAMVTGLDERAIPGVIYGEARILRAYDDLLALNPDAGLRALLERQRATLSSCVAELDSLEDAPLRG
jgi:uncharacterized protein (TIGR02284 family)